MFWFIVFVAFIFFSLLFCFVFFHLNNDAIGVFSPFSFFYLILVHWQAKFVVVLLHNMDSYRVVQSYTIFFISCRTIKKSCCSTKNITIYSIRDFFTKKTKSDCALVRVCDRQNKTDYIII